MSIAKRIALAALSSVFAFSAPTLLADNAKVEAGNWPEFHGPRRDNISLETGLLKQWPADGPTKVWEIKNIGDGFSTVSVVGDRIYTAGDEAESSYVYGLNAADGSQLWKSKLGKIGGQNGAGPRATPTFDEGTLYMIGQVGDVVAYRAADGRELWRKNLNGDFGGKMMSGWGNSESLVIDGANVICTPGGGGGTLMALNKKTGETVWRSKEFTDKAAYTSPVIADFGGVHQGVVYTDNSVAGISLADGKLLWRADRPGKTAVIPTPVVKVDDANTAHVYVTSGYGIGCDLFKITAAGGKFTAAPVYTGNKTMVDHHGGVILLDGLIYGHSDQGGWTCQDMLTGKAKWADSKILGKGTISYADGRFYLRDEKNGVIVLLEANGDKHEERGRFQQPDRSRKSAWPHIVIANGKMYIRDQGVLLCYDVKAK